MKSEFRQEDMKLLKWPMVMLVGTLLASGLWYGVAFQFKEWRSLAMQAAKANRLEAISSVRQIEEETRIVGDYFDRFQKLQLKRVIGEEDRLELIETLDLMRARHLLYPFQLDVDQQASLPLNPDGGLQVRASRIHLDIPLLHEEDLFRLLEGLEQMERGIFVTETCVMKRIGSDAVSQTPLYRPNLTAACTLLWLTMDRQASLPPEPPPPR